MHTVASGNSCFDCRRCHLAGAPKGTQMAFSTGGGSLKVTINGMHTPYAHHAHDTTLHVHVHVCIPLHIPRKVAINDKSVGAISSKPLCEAFANIYKDKNAVCTMTPVGADGEVWVSFSNRAAPGPKPKPKPKPNQVSAAANLGLAYALKGAMLGAAAGFGYSKVAA